MPPVLQRANGSLELTCKLHGYQTVLDDLRQQGSSKILFPSAHTKILSGVIINTAGGLTGGDSFNISASTVSGCHLALTTQAAERIYRTKSSDTATVANRLTIGQSSRLDWVPQETILFDKSSLKRRLDVEMHETAQLLIVEPVIFGRKQMGETLSNIVFQDQISVSQMGRLVFSDRTNIGDDISTVRNSICGMAGGGALVSVLLISPNAASFLQPAREMMTVTGGVSLVREGVLFSRILAEDGFALRKAMIPLIELLSGNPIPKTWMI